MSFPVGLLIVFWFGLALFNLWSLRGATILRPDSPVADLAETPKVSIILAARNEEEALPSTLDSLLRLDYPDYEVILIDDDSHDHTGAIAEEWAEKNPAAAKELIAKRFSLDAEALMRSHCASRAMDDEARWLRNHEGGDAPGIPNYSTFVAAGPLRSVKPSAVTLFTPTGSTLPADGFFQPAALR